MSQRTRALLWPHHPFGRVASTSMVGAAPVTADSRKSTLLVIRPVTPRRLHAEQRELARDISRRDLVSARACFSSFERIVGDKRDVRLEAIGAEAG